MQEFPKMAELFDELDEDTVLMQMSAGRALPIVYTEKEKAVAHVVCHIDNFHNLLTHLYDTFKDKFDSETTAWLKESLHNYNYYDNQNN